jgi:DNA-binding Lrp family transcriptional regulator
MWYIITLAAQSKLDCKDLAIIDALARDSTLGRRSLSKLTGISEQSTRTKLNKIKRLLAIPCQ